MTIHNHNLHFSNVLVCNFFYSIVRWFPSYNNKVVIFAHYTWQMHIFAIQIMFIIIWLTSPLSVDTTRYLLLSYMIFR